MKWEYRDTNIPGNGKDIIYAEGKFWFVHSLPCGIAYSDDLINWNDYKFDSNKISSTENLAYGNDLFIVTGDSGSTDKTYFLVSKDGAEWEYKILDTGQNFSMTSNTCRFFNNRFVFTTGYYNYNISTGIRNYTVVQFFETINGDEIIRHDFRHVGPENMSIMDIAYGNGKYVAVGSTGTILISSDLDNWKVIDAGTTKKLVGITFGRNLFVITGADGIILTSKDGVNWTKQTSNTNSYLIRSRYGNGMFVAAGYNGTILSSLNGDEWQNEDKLLNNVIYYGLVFANNYYVITSSKLKNGNVPIMLCQVSREVEYSENEALYVFDKNLELLGVIDQFISLRWRRKYYESGEFELVVAPYENNLSLLFEKDRIIIRQDYTEAGIIDTVELTDDGKNVQLSVSGKFLSYLTNRRIIKKTINFKGNVIDAQKKLLSEVTPLSSEFEVEETTLESKLIEFQCSYKNLYKYLCKLSKYGNVGFRIVPNIQNKVFRFENYVGLDRTSSQSINEKYCFSTLRKNCEKSNYLSTSVNKCNYVLVGGVGDGSDRVLVEIKDGDASGFDLVEVFVDAKNENNTNLTSTEYKNILKTKGEEKLSSGEESIEVTASGNDYKNKWDLGDIVDIEVENCNVRQSLRITEVEEVIENGKREIYPTFGQPLAEDFELD